MKLTNMPPKFFITHSWKDIEFARRLCDDLRAHGLEGFFDAYSIQPGDDIAGRIAHGLENCDVYIPLLSPAAVASKWCELEINTAINLSMDAGRDGRPKIIPVVVKRCDLPTLLRGKLYINFEGGYDAALNELLTKGLSVSPYKSQPAPIRPALPMLSRTGLLVGGGVIGVLLLCVLGAWMVGQLGATTFTTPTRVSLAPATITVALTNTPMPTITTGPTALPTKVIPTSTSTPTNTSSPTVTPRPVAPTPTLGIGSSKTAESGAVMVYVPAGEFLMGSSDADKLAGDAEKPQHKVYLNAFWIDKSEVTNALYKKCVDDGKCPVPFHWTNETIPLGKENHPVVNVSWDDINGYLQWLNQKTGKVYRLPTEAEWEKAACWDAAKQVKLIYPWGNIFDPSLLNSSEGGKKDTMPVGSYAGGASPSGAMDMAGNVWEWVADWYDGQYYSKSPTNNPKGPDSGQYRIFRGGSWFNLDDFARCAYRYYYLPDDRYNFIGFRVAESFP